MSSFARQALIVLAVVALAYLAWRVAYALLLAFGGILFALFLRGVAGALARRTRLGMRVSLAAVGLVLLAGVALGRLRSGRKSPNASTSLAAPSRKAQARRARICGRRNGGRRYWSSRVISWGRRAAC